MPKLKLQKLPRTFEIDQDLQEDTDYIIAFRIARTGTFLPDKHGEEQVEEVFMTDYINIEHLQRIGTNSTIKIKSKKGQSVVQRILLEEIGELLGKNGKDYYIDYISRHIDRLIEKRDILKAKGSLTPTNKQ